MKKTHNGKQVPFFHIFNKLSDSINFTQRLFLSFIFIAVPVMAALLSLIHISEPTRPY